MRRNVMVIVGLVAAGGFYGAFLAGEARARRTARTTGRLELVRVPVRPPEGLSAEASAIGRYPIYEPTDTTLLREAFAQAEKLTTRRR